MSTYYKEFGSTQIAMTTVQSILIILNITGNSLVCAIILKNQDMRTSINYLIMNLAVADMMAAAFFAPRVIFIHTFTHPGGVTGDVLCKLLTGGQLAYVAAAASVFTLVAIAIERYYAVLYPYVNKGRLTDRKLKVIIPCSWIFGVIMSIPAFLVRSFDKEVHFCTITFPDEWMGKAYSCIWCLLVAFLPVSLMVTLYSRVVYALWFKSIDPIESNSLQQGVMRVRKRVTLMVITVSIIFAVCWLNDTIQYILFYYTSTPVYYGDVKHVITDTLIMFNSTVNPIIYALLNQRFREKMKLMLRSCCRPTTNRIHPARESQRMQVVNSTTHPTLETGESAME